MQLYACFGLHNSWKVSSRSWWLVIWPGQRRASFRFFSTMRRISNISILMFHADTVLYCIASVSLSLSKFMSFCLPFLCIVHVFYLSPRVSPIYISTKIESGSIGEDFWVLIILKCMVGGLFVQSKLMLGGGRFAPE